MDLQVNKRRRVSEPETDEVPMEEDPSQNVMVDDPVEEAEEQETGAPRIRVDGDIEMKEEDLEDNMPLSELMEMKKRQEMMLEPTSAKPPDKELMQAVRRVHNNLGHLETSKLVRALRIAGAKEEAIDAAKRLHMTFANS